MKADYIIAIEDDLIDLALAVNCRIKEGYICQGGITITSAGLKVQAMILNTEYKKIMENIAKFKEFIHRELENLP